MAGLVLCLNSSVYSLRNYKSATARKVRNSVDGGAEVSPCQFNFVVKVSLKFSTERIGVLDTICIELTYMSFIIKQLSNGAWTQ